MNPVFVLVPILAAAPLAAVALSAVREAPWLHTEERRCVRAVYFSRTGVGGSYAIDYGSPEWKAEYDASFEEMTRGKRLRLGQNAWTTLDATCPIRFGARKDAKDVAAGHYYLALERDKRGEWFLVVLESEDLRKKRVDAFQSESTSGGILVPLHHEEAQSSAPRLEISLEAVDDDDAAQTLRVRWGKHVLSTRVEGKA